MTHNFIKQLNLTSVNNQQWSAFVAFFGGWGGYRQAMESAYGADSGHIVTTPFTDADMSTNLMERWNGTLKDRLKPMRGMERNTNFQVILDGFVFYYNYLRPHTSLGGKTPAEVAKVSLPFKSWGDVVKSQLPNLKVPKGVRIAYRTRRKVKAIASRVKRQRRAETSTILGRIR